MSSATQGTQNELEKPLVLEQKKPYAQSKRRSCKNVGVRVVLQIPKDMEMA